MSLLEHIGDELTELSLSELAICCTMINSEIKSRKTNKYQIDMFNV